MRREVDDYVDTKLANFEVVLDKTLAAVRARPGQAQRPQPRTATSRSPRSAAPPRTRSTTRPDGPPTRSARRPRGFGPCGDGQVAFPGPTRGPSPTEPDVSMPEETRRTAHRLDPRSPLVLDTRELGRRPGSMRPLSRSVPAPADLGVDVLGVPEGSAARAGPPARVGRGGRARLRHGDRHRVRGVRALPRPGQPDARGRRPGALRLPAATGARTIATADGTRTGRPASLEGDLLDLEPVAAGRGGAGTAAPAAVPGRLPRSVLRVRGAAGRTTRGTRHDEVDPRWAALRQLDD